MTFNLIISFLINLLAVNNNEPFGEHPLFFEKYKDLLVNIREEYLTPKEAETEFKAIMLTLREKYPLDTTVAPSPMAFPLINSDFKAVGGRNGNGFRGNGFNLFDNTVSGSHPAQDIFIYDRNYDSKDDRYNNYTDIVSVSNGIVLATEENWEPGSSYKGGNYVWIYDYERGGLWYYAHCRMVAVKPGQTIKVGDKLGEVGRTGNNAYKLRSDTHLHLSYLELDEDLYPHPYNHYQWLKSSRTLHAATQAKPYNAPSRIEKIKTENFYSETQTRLLSKTKSEKYEKHLPIKHSPGFF